MESALATPDKAIIAGFFVVMLGIGFYFAGRMQNLKDYFSGGRQVPWWLSGASMWMSSFSAFAFIAYSQLAYEYGLASVTLFWTGVPAIALSAYLLATRWRRAATTSPLEYIETRYGPALRQGLAWIGIPMTVIDDALKLVAIGTLLSVSLHIDKPWVIIGAGGLMLLYTFMGGLWAVLVTDFVQFLIMLIAIVVLVPLSLAKVGGMTAFVEQSPEGFFSFASGKYTPWFVFSFFVIMFFSTATRWSFVQRYYAVKSDRDARKVGYLVAALNLIGPPIMFLPAMAARQYLVEIENTEDIYALICTTLLPVGMMGMIIAAMFSATMSMLSSDYNAVAAVITNDVYRKVFGRNTSEKSLVWVGRIATLVIGIIAIVVALYLVLASRKSDLFTIMTQLFGVLLPPMAIPMIAGLVTRRVSYAGGLAAFGLSAAAGVTAFVLGGMEQFAFLRDISYLTWITSGSAVFGLLIGTLIRPNTREEDERNGRFLDGLAGRHDPAEADEETTSTLVSPLPIIGASTAALGALLVGVLLVSVPLRECVASMVTGSVMLVTGLGFWVWPKVRRNAG